ncbi:MULTISPECIES: LysR family transcriptional regulator [Streptomyces]|uniref:LysR family transcriptional regulator n=3 Tax=Streptomyces rimosus TaxID=1927 RepID=A0A8A1V191_STRR1|nr:MULTISPECIES: LysR family transcriptional regulator [Streptomyces]KOG79686.1 LysR family transcriptional regulator [Kitasatospora aureofaciens]MYT42506.1 LysR family transcriptional regulator [Streptomyces sp. SID5471]KOT44052.1 LysR family transcriptional regulator [Streptomyces sp. NRRL WC-3701]KOT63689.1 LysR family transcriptional regulator [Streptomyces rimosus subsp. rimosus]KOT64436.1 LysR family transcriptional regulator [Streptomyces rimosus subsp. rimosus]
MRVEQLEYLMAVKRLGSLRRAAESLYMSQPALGETLGKLERELGVELMERRRSGAKISREGLELLPHIAAVLDAVDRLRQAADEQLHTNRTLRLGTVNAATVALLTPAIREFRTTHPSTQVEVVADRHDGIQQHLIEGGLDLGIVSYLLDDDLPSELHTTELLRGRPVVCIRQDSPLAALKAVTVADLLAHPLITMRAGYVMHRYIRCLLSGSTPPFSYSAEGAEMGKLMVAEGLGAAVLPDYSVHGDPLERSGTITCRPLADDNTEFRVMLQQRHAHTTRTAAHDLHSTLVRQAERRRANLPTRRKEQR